MSNERGSCPSRRFKCAHIVAAALPMLLAAPLARSATIAVPCAAGDPSPLITAIGTANTNPGADTLVLAAGCTYMLTAGELAVTSDITIQGNGAILERTVSATPFRLLNVLPGASLVIDGLTLRKGFKNTGGAIRNTGALTLSNSLLSDNTYEFGCGGGDEDGCFLGGAIYNAASATLTVANSTFLRNDSVGGGAIANRGTMTVQDSSFIRNTSFGFGGGINSTGMATVTGTTFSENHSDTGSGILSNGTLTVTNSTFSGSSGGAGITAGGIATVTSSTITGNRRETTPSNNVGGVLALSGTVTLVNTIVANSVGVGIVNCMGPITNGGGNLSSDSSCPGFLQGNPLLGPLQSNGGPTQTHALQNGSPALNVIAPANCTVATDQRGVPRPQNTNCDIGSFEAKLSNYTFSGFFSPVDNVPTFNVVNAGRAIPLKFSLNSDQGLDIFAGGYPASRQVQCEGGAPSDTIEQTVTAGGSSLQYNAGTQTYIYVWKTNKAWAGTCRELLVRLDDGTDHTAVFQFK